MTKSELIQKDNKNVQKTVTCSEPRTSVTFTPRFDSWETAEAIVLSGDLPGVSADALDIQFEGDQLTIHGAVGERGDGRKSLHSEYGIGDFHRSFTIGETVESERISAELDGGVLTVTLPKSNRARPRRIEVTEG